MQKYKRRYRRKTREICKYIGYCTHQGVPQGRKNLHCGTPFLMVRNLSDYGFYCPFALTDLEKNVTVTVLFLTGIRFNLLLYVGLF